MDKKILFLIFIAFLVVIPAGKVGATQYFVGVTVASGQAPGYPAGTTDSNWCLPSQATQFYIRNSGGTALPVCTTSVTTNCYVSPTVNPVTLSGPACAGDTVWSALFDLTSGTTYQVYFYINAYYNAYCPGFGGTGSSSETCWVSWDVAGQNKSCADVCTHYGLTNNIYTGTYPLLYQAAANNCSREAYLMGGTCSSCSTSATYNYYDPATYACYSTTTYYNTGDTNGTATLGTDLVRVCACNYQGNYTWPAFTFTFTPTF